MKKIIYSVIITLLLTVINLSANQLTRTNKTSLPFIENRGQFNKDIRFGVNTFGGNVYITERRELIYTLTSKEKEQSVTFRESFLTDSESSVFGENLIQTKVNYFLGSDKTKWQSNIPAYEAINMGKLYAGIEVRLKAHGDNVEKLFYLEPQANINDIKITLSGVNSFEISPSGELILTTPTGKVSLTKPFAYQIDDAGNVENVAVSYTLKGNCYGFAVGDYDTDRELIIDPLLSSTFLGGTSADDDYGPSLLTDDDGYVYLCGYTSSSDFPTANGYDLAYNGGKDIFISKFSSDLSTLLASTFIGGSGNDFEATMCFDAEQENLFISGYTSSTDFPITENAFDTTNNGGSDCYLLKIDKELSDLQASTYFGGSANEGQQWPKLDIAVGQSSNVYVTGLTRSVDFPVLQNISHDSTYAGGTNGGDAFVVKFDCDLSALLASSYIGGSSNEWRMSLDIDSEENIFVCGETESGDFTFTPDAYDSSFNGASDIFICKYNNNLSELVSATCLGRNNYEEPLDIAVDNDDEVFISGYTKSSNFPTTAGSYDHNFSGGDRDGYIARFSNDLSELISSTFLGGNLRDDVTTIFIDSTGLIYVAGNTTSTNFPTSLNAFDFIYNGGSDYGDAFVSVLDNDLTQLHASTYIGGNLDDRALDITLNSENDIVIAGYSKSAEFPVIAQAYDSLNSDGYCDCFISVFTPDLTGNIVSAEPDSDLQNAVKTNLYCYPNPFYPATAKTERSSGINISCNIVEKGMYNLEIYNLRGQLVKTLHQGFLEKGEQSFIWNGLDNENNALSSGIYLTRIHNHKFHNVAKLVLLK